MPGAGGVGPGRVPGAGGPHRLPHDKDPDPGSRQGHRRRGALPPQAGVSGRNPAHAPGKPSSSLSIHYFMFITPQELHQYVLGLD